MTKKKHMTRDEVIKALKIYGADLAKEFGLKNMQVSEDRTKGVWGEEFVKYLEQKYGSCTDEILWFNGDDHRNSNIVVEFRFRFASPCLSVFLDYRKTLASIEFGQCYKKNDKGECIVDNNGYLIGDGVYRPKEIHCWGEGSLELIKRIVKESEKRTRTKMVNTYFGEEDV